MSSYLFGLGVILLVITMIAYAAFDNRLIEVYTVELDIAAITGLFLFLIGLLGIQQGTII